MDKKTALTILINDSSLIDEDKKKILAEVEFMDEQTIYDLGNALAQQKKQEIDAAKNAIPVIEKFLEDTKEEESLL